MPHGRRLSPWIPITALAAVAAVEILRLGSLSFNHDEVWHIWQTFGSLPEILAWTPYDGAPLYPLLLAGWRAAVGIHPLVLRMLSVLLALLGAALTYRAGRRLGGDVAGLLSLLAFSALPYAMFLSGYVRPYALAQALLPAGFYLALRTFDAGSGIAFRYELWLTLVLTASIYTTLLAPLWILAFLLFTLVAFPLRRTLGRWIPIGIGVLTLSVPLLIARGAIAFGRTVERSDPSALLGELSAEYLGAAWWAWGLLAVAGLGGWLVRRDRIRIVSGLLVWALGLPAGLYLLDPMLGLFRASYLFWSLAGAALALGVTLAFLPRTATLAAGVLLGCLLFVPVSRRVEQSYGASGTAPLIRLSRQIRAGDVIVVDPKFACLQPFEWDYYARALFPQGLRLAGAPPPAGPAWYALDVGDYDAGTAADVGRGRVASLQAGDPDCRFVLLEAPPNQAGRVLDNGMIFHGAERIERSGERPVPLDDPLALHEGEPIVLRLWWSVLTPTNMPYQTRLALLDSSSRMLAVSEAPPQVDPPQTDRWEVGRYYMEERSLTLPYPLETGSYVLSLSVHAQGNQPRASLWQDLAASRLLLTTLSVRAW